MNPARKGLFAAALLGSVFAGGAVGVALFGPASATAQTTTTTTPANPSAGATTTVPGTFHANETPSHEAAETPSQEVAENSGTGHCAHPGGNSGANSGQTNSPQTNTSGA